MKYQIAFVVLVVAYTALAAVPTADVEEKIWKNLEETETTRVKVSFRKADTKAALKRFQSLKLSSRAAKLSTQYAILKDHADIVQADVLSLLTKIISQGKKHTVNQLWVSNELIVDDVDKATVEILRNHPDVKALEADRVIILDDFVEETVSPRSGTVQWNIEKVGARKIWEMGYTGQDVVFGITDTGINPNHVDLKDNIAGWFDAVLHLPLKLDLNGHGTHTAGTIVGQNGIGVAPGAKVYACRGCADFLCFATHLQLCGQHFLCPNTPTCSEAPHGVSNSWGGDKDDTSYNAIIDAWNSVGIVGVFAIGNNGSSCNTADSPGNHPEVIGVGSTGQNDSVSTFSGRGPTDNDEIKPDFAVPGENIVSASHLSTTGYTTMSGTSMATPLVAGFVALYKSMNPGATYDETYDFLKSISRPTTPTGKSITSFKTKTNRTNWTFLLLRFIMWWYSRLRISEQSCWSWAPDCQCPLLIL